MEPGEVQAAFEGEVVRFRETLAKGRSANQLALFDLLVERSGEERSPKEVEIALALFGEGANLASSADSGVRVYVHRLRKRMHDHYRGKRGFRLVIPKGEYRIVLEGAEQDGAEASPPSWLPLVPRADRAMVAVFLAIGLAMSAFAVWSLWSNSPDQLEASDTVRSPLLQPSGVPLKPMIAIGDSLLLAETEDQRSIQRLILNPTVRTRGEFSKYLKEHPESFYQLYDFNLNLAPFNAVEAAWTVRDKFDAPSKLAIDDSRITTVSGLRPENLDSDDVIFIGRLSQLGWLEPYVFSRARIRLAAFDRLTDSVNGAQFRGEVYHDGQSEHRADYGYVSVQTSPAGRRLIVLAGLGDHATKSVVSLLESQKDIDLLKRKVRGARNFEAVFEVEVRRGEPTKRRLVAAYALS